MNDYRRQDRHQRQVRHGNSLDSGGGSSDVIPQDSFSRLELAGFRIRPPIMAPLQPPSTHTQTASMLLYRGNCRQSKVRSRTRSGDSYRSEVSDASAYTATSERKPTPRTPPIAGDVFAMHPELLASSTPKRSAGETDGPFSPLSYWKHKRRHSGTVASPLPSPSPVATSHSPSIIFIDCPAD